MENERIEKLVKELNELGVDITYNESKYILNFRDEIFQALRQITVKHYTDQTINEKEYKKIKDLLEELKNIVISKANQEYDRLEKLKSKREQESEQGYVFYDYSENIENREEKEEEAEKDYSDSIEDSFDNIEEISRLEKEIDEIEEALKNPIENEKDRTREAILTERLEQLQEELLDKYAKDKEITENAEKEHSDSFDNIEEILRLEKEIDEIEEALKNPIENEKDKTREAILLERLEQLQEELLDKYAKDTEKKENIDKEDDNRGKKIYDWHPQLKEIQREELEAEGIEPGDPEYFLALRNYGIKDDGPFHYEKEVRNEKNPELPGEERLGLPDKGRTPESPNNGGTPELPGEERLGLPDKGKTPDQPNNPENLPIRSFWEIVASTHTQHIGNMEYFMYKLANAPLNPIPKNTDTMQKLLGTAINVVQTPFKIIAKPISAAMGTKAKVNEMRENLENLAENNEAEFAVLTMSPEMANKEMGRKVKDEFETEYLDTQTMKDGLINSAYLDIVGNILKEKEGQRLNDINQIIEGLEKDSKNILADINNPEKASEKSTNNNLLLSNEKEITEQRKQALALKNRIDAYEFAAEHRSGKFRDVPGWIAGKRQPDNREVEAQLAEISKERREANERGEEVRVSQLSAEMRDISNGETDIRTIGRNVNNKISRGNHCRGQIEFANMQEQNKGRLALANFAIFSTVTRALTDLHNAKEAAEANQVNSNLSAQVTPADHVKTEIDNATVQEAGKEGLAAGTTREYIDITNGKYGQDVADHVAEADMAKDGLDLSETSPYLKDIIQKATKNNTFGDHNDAWIHDGMVQAIKQIGDGQGFKDLITALNKTITVPVNGKMVDYVIDPATYATLVGTVLSTRTQNIMKKAKAKITGKDIDETKGNEETIKGSEDNELDQEEDLEL